MVGDKYIAGPDITELEISIVTDMMKNGWYDYNYVEKFQNEFAKYHDRKYGIMTPNCTSAIHLLLKALDIGNGDSVIVPDFTWIGSSAGITYVGAKPTFADIEYNSWCIDPKSVSRCLQSNTKVIIVVDVYGNMPQMEKLEEICNRHNILLIEDAAEAIGSTYKGKKAGSFGLASVFSFHRTKTITAGEGGMIVLDDDKLYERCMMLRDHGRPIKGGKLYYNYEVTPKYMPSNLQASIGYAQFLRIDELISKKRTILQMYRENLYEVEDIQLNIEPIDGRNGAWLVVMLIGKEYNIDKEQMMLKMRERGIATRPFFYPLSTLPAYEYMNGCGLNPVSIDIGGRGICLPSAGIIKEIHIRETCNVIKDILNG